MFTGIVEEVGMVLAHKPPRLVLGAQTVLSDLKVGDSIAVNGACLTVVDRDEKSFVVEISPETRRRTNLGGHLVQGHIEATARILSVEPDGEAVKVRFSVPPGLARYIVPKGFIAVDGVSLTVIDADKDGFSVMLIPFTRQHTALGAKGPGDLVNIETDIIGRYIERLLKEAGRLGPGK